MRSRLVLIIPILALVLAACSSSGSSPSASAVATAAPTTAPSVAPSASASQPTASVNLTIYGAASLQGVLAATKLAYEKANQGVTLTISTDASSALATQIEQGAPADVFLSADTKNPQDLVTKGLAVAPPMVYATNKLTVIVPTANPAAIQTPLGLSRPNAKVIAAGDAVPITKYANMLVANLAKQPGYPADFAALYTANIASKEDNVKAAVAKIELGEGDGAIVYVTDAKVSTKVKTVDVPDAAQVLATYAGVTIKASPNLTAAQAFLTWFAGPDGQAILSGFGFLPPS